ncbi:helix-turn-helix transcriptional regulator [Acetivibrio straminisolvens]|jgi:AraC family L-rhamnose operon regulatory protein RhaS|uniref:Response regulator receiver n=1 Tax=Acetivibrio straminisolvens JCM 21531 TaxID=1294263 RepID=W4V306_9FIRM|nr:response regulator transcription factor [Acetivibrio straminisolvens]GAE87581.1 response regulator receiver [Acetivibrio straminisolvens JCM 21531]
MDLFTRSYDKDWNRIVYLKVLENQEACFHLKDDQTCKLILFLEGNSTITYNNQTAFITAPSVLCLNHLDTVEFDNNPACKITVLFFRPIALNDQLEYSIFHRSYYQKMVGTTLFQDLTLLSSFYDINNSKRELILLDAVSAVSLTQLLNKINKELIEQKDGYWPCRSRSYFIELLFFLEGLRCNESLQNISIVLEKNRNDIVHNIVRYLNQNIDKKITLEHLEKTFACNRNQINKEFQKELNTTVMKYFTQMRMQLASILLRDTEIPILDVALRVGYSDAGYFSKAFKSYCGISPSEYRDSFYSTISPA